METYITISKINSQWEVAVWLRELKSGLCNTLEGWDGRKVRGRFEREGTYIYLWQVHVDVWQKPTQFCKAIILQLKYKLKKKKKNTRVSFHFFLKGIFPDPGSEPKSPAWQVDSLLLSHLGNSC